MAQDAVLLPFVTVISRHRRLGCDQRVALGVLVLLRSHPQGLGHHVHLPLDRRPPGVRPRNASNSDESKPSCSGEIQRVAARNSRTSSSISRSIGLIANGGTSAPLALRRYQVIEVDRLRGGLSLTRANAVDCGSRSRPRTLASASSARWPRSTASRSLPEVDFPHRDAVFVSGRCDLPHGLVTYRIAVPAQFTSRFARSAGRSAGADLCRCAHLVCPAMGVVPAMPPKCIGDQHAAAVRVPDADAATRPMSRSIAPMRTSWSTSKAHP